MIAQPRRFFVIFSHDRQLELLLQPLQRFHGPFTLHFPAPVNERLQLRTVLLSVFLLVFAKKLADRLDAGVDRRSAVG